MRRIPPKPCEPADPTDTAAHSGEDDDGAEDGPDDIGSALVAGRAITRRRFSVVPSDPRE